MYSQNNDNSLRNIVLASVGAIALSVSLYYLSREKGFDTKIDIKKKHTKKRLQELMGEFQLEYTCIYARNYNIMLRSKEAGDFTPTDLEALRKQVKNEIDDKTEQVLADFCWKCHPKPHVMGKADGYPEKETESDHKKVPILLAEFIRWVEEFNKESFITE